MIKSLELTNFFSFRHEKIPINSKTNIFIGINGSGKTNFLKALSLLKVGVEGKVDTALQDLITSKYGGFDMIFCKSDEDVEFHDTIGLEFIFDNAILASYGYPFEKHNNKNVCYKIIIKKQVGTENYFLSEKIYAGSYVYLDFYNGKGRVSERNEETGEVQLVSYSDLFSSQELTLSKVSEFDKQRFFPLVTIKNAIKDINIYNYFDTTENSGLRKAMSATSSIKQLLPNGTNLPQILNYIKINDKAAYKKIQERLKDINPHFNTFDFNFLGASGVIELMLEEENLKTSIHVSHISDGTLRYLCLMAILYNPYKGKLICLDEPEVGLHPDMVYNVSRAIKEATQNATIIVSTHSPELLNYFNLEEVLVFEKNDLNTTKVNTFTENEFEGWYETFMPGKMWKSGDLGGKRWQ